MGSRSNTAAAMGGGGRCGALKAAPAPSLLRRLGLVCVGQHGGIMMAYDLAKLLGLRPKGDDVASLRAAQSAAIEARRAAAARVNDLEVRRGGVLLDGNSGAVAAHEAALAEARGDVERAEAMADAIKPRLAAAEVREAVAELRRLRAEAEREATAAERWFKSEYQALAVKLAEGLAHERRVAQLAERVVSESSRLAQLGIELDEADQRYIPLLAKRFAPSWFGNIGDAVLLPSLEGPAGEALPIWPQGPCQ